MCFESTNNAIRKRILCFVVRNRSLIRRILMNWRVRLLWRILLWGISLLRHVPLRSISLWHVRRVPLRHVPLRRVGRIAPYRVGELLVPIVVIASIISTPAPAATPAPALAATATPAATPAAISPSSATATVLATVAATATILATGESGRQPLLARSLVTVLGGRQSHFADGEGEPVFHASRRF